MKLFDERRYSSQPIATESGKRGRKAPQSAVTADSTTNETAVGRDQAIM